MSTSGTPEKTKKTKKKEEPPHYTGHRARMRKKLLEAGAAAFQEYELLEMLLMYAIPRRDVKPYAKALLKEFGSLSGVANADPARLAAFPWAKESVRTFLKLLKFTMLAMLRSKIEKRPLLDCWESLVDYCQAAMGHEKIEIVRMLYLDTKLYLIADEVEQAGSVDRTVLYPRSVLKRALDIGASSVVVVHNHPSGDLKPSSADVRLTEALGKALKAAEIALIDHLIVSKDGVYSFRDAGLLL